MAMYYIHVKVLTSRKTKIHGRVVVVELVVFDTDIVFMFGLVPIPS